MNPAHQPRPSIGMVATEASGDQLGAHLIYALKAYFPQAQFVGVGGPKMLAAGIDSLFPLDKLARHGYVEILRHLPQIMWIRRKIRNYFLRHRPQILIGIDSPDFNLGLEEKLKKRGVTTIHYVSPSIWAWRGERIHKIKRAVSHMLTLFPFEAPLYEKAGIPVTYVGHPLAEMLPDAPDRDAAREQMRLTPSAKIFALLPGSRPNELHYMADTFIETAKRILQEQPDAQFLVPLHSRETRDQFESALYRNHAQDLPLTILFGHTHNALTVADAALIASGTATLEALLLKCPMVITYKANELSFRIVKSKYYLPYVGLPNILAGEFIAPEILQSDATPENLAQALMNLAADQIVVERLRRKFSAIHSKLRQNTAQRAAQAILPYLESHGVKCDSTANLRGG
ncbi:MAG TPA: lipid-A-disaccharide synthase [Burkholderiales bacterium]|nr:lipid-A-disaccharide synthase [Burkholderiales bacterium]